MFELVVGKKLVELLLAQKEVGQVIFPPSSSSSHSFSSSTTTTTSSSSSYSCFVF